MCEKREIWRIVLHHFLKAASFPFGTEPLLRRFDCERTFFKRKTNLRKEYFARFLAYFVRKYMPEGA